MFDTTEKLEIYLKKHGIVGAWIIYDEQSFSKIFRFELFGVEFKIKWFPNYSTIAIAGVAEHWFDRIDDENTYPVRGGGWLNFKMGDHDTGLHVKIS